MGYHTSYAFTAPADVVFDAVSDLALVTGWLAETLDVRHRPDGIVEVRGIGGAAPAPDRPTRFEATVPAGRLRLEWRATSGEPAWSGQLVVSSLPVGGSVIQVKLNLPEARPAWFPLIDQVVSQLLRRLDAEAVRAMAAAPTRAARSAA